MKITFVLTMILLPSIVFAYPRFGALAGEKCSSCHFNINGGGIRTERGNLFAAENLMMKTFQTEDYDFDPQINEKIRIGGDMRTMTFADEKSKSASLIQMEGSIYGLYSLSKSIKVYSTLAFNGLTNGFTTYNNSELYGKFSPTSFGYYFKAGYFVPDYGLRTPDHRAFTREETGLSNFGYYVGFENGIEQEDWNISTYIGNVNSGSAEYGNKNKMGIITGRYLFNFSEISTLWGVSYMSLPNKNNVSVFNHLSLVNLISFSDEFIFTSDKSSGTELKGYIYLGELTVAPIEGLQIRGQFDFLKPDKGSESGQQSRFTIGIPLFFTTGFELEPMIQQQTDKIADPVNPGSFKEISFASGLLMTHFYF